MKRVLIASLAVAGCGLLGAPAAEARDVRAGSLTGGPVLAGAHVAWAERAGRRLRVRTQRGSAPRRTVAAFPRDRRHSVRVRLAASPALLGVEVISESRGDRDVFAGPVGGPLTTLGAGCPIASLYPRTIDVSGRSVFFIDCATQPRIRDFGSGASEPLSAGSRGLRLAGSYAAWLEGEMGNESLVVYDRRARRPIYTVPSDVAPYGIQDLDLQDDGTVAFVYYAPAGPRATVRARVGWASVREPRLHPTSLKAADNYHVKIARGRIGFARGPEFSGVLRTTIGYLTIASDRSRIVATGGEDDVFDEHFDFDGKRLAWYSWGCRQAVVHVTPLDRRVRASRHCRLRLRGAATARSGRIRLDINCFGFAGDVCYAKRVRVRSRGSLIATSRRSGIRLTRSGRRLLRSSPRRSLRVRIVATIVDNLGRRERRATSAALRLR